MIYITFQKRKKQTKFKTRKKYNKCKIINLKYHNLQINLEKAHLFIKLLILKRRNLNFNYKNCIFLTI